MTSINKVVKGCKGVPAVTACGAVIDVASGTPCRSLYWKWSLAKIAIIDPLLVTTSMARKAPFVVKSTNDCPYA